MTNTPIGEKPPVTSGTSTAPYAADDFAAIAKRIAELEREKQNPPASADGWLAFWGHYPA